MKDLQQWDLIITPHKSWLDLQLRDLWRFRDLIVLFVKRDFVTLYKQTLLGPLWYVIQPLLSTIIFTIIFGRIAKIPTDGIPHSLFYISGIVCWNYFADCLTTTSGTFISNASIFGKVYFPRLAVPISVVLSNMIKFAIQNLLLVALYTYYVLQGANVAPTLYLLALPLVIFQMALLGLGFGILVSSLTTKYRDLSLLVGFGVQLWMFATPVVYPLSQVPEKFRALYHFNPMATVIANFRSMLLGVGSVEASNTAISWMITAIVLIVGILIFNRIERSFMDTV